MLHKIFDFTQLGGFPFSQDVLRYMQESYADLASVICKLAGNNVIVDGVVTDGDQISDGWIVYNDELLPFKGGKKKEYFTIVELPESLLFEDGVSKPVKISKFARLASSGILLSSLKRLTNTKNLLSRLSTVESRLNPRDVLSLEAGGKYNLRVIISMDNIARIEGVFYVESMDLGYGVEVPVSNLPFHLDDNDFIATAYFRREGEAYVSPCEVGTRDTDFYFKALYSPSDSELYEAFVIVSNSFLFSR